MKETKLYPSDWLLFWINVKLMWHNNLCYNYQSAISLLHLRPLYANDNDKEIRVSKEISTCELNYHKILLMCNIWIEISPRDW